MEDGKNVEKVKCKFYSKIYIAESKSGIGHLSKYRKKCLALHKPIDWWGGFTDPNFYCWSW